MDRLLHNLPPTDAIRDEPLRRIEVITGVERRRRWSEQDKARIVAESLKPGVIVAEVARRYGMHRNQFYGWRSAFGVQPAKTGQTCKARSFVPVTVVPETPEGSVSGAVIEIVIGSVSFRLTGAIDAAALRQVLEAVRSLP
jgi:transposase